MKKFVALLGTIASLTLCAAASSASATNFLFTNSGDSGNGAFGTLIATNGSGNFTATSGTITAFGPVVTGTGFLIADPSAPGGAKSPGGFDYDDQLFVGQNFVVDDLGLVFNIGGVEFNLTGGGFDPYPYLLTSFTDGSVGDFTLIQSSVPEPSTWAMMLFGFGVLGFVSRIQRQNVRVTYA